MPMDQKDDRVGSKSEEGRVGVILPLQAIELVALTSVLWLLFATVFSFFSPRLA